MDHRADCKTNSLEYFTEHVLSPEARAMGRKKGKSILWEQPHSSQDSPSVTVQKDTYLFTPPWARRGPEEHTVKYHWTKNSHTALDFLLLSDKHFPKLLSTVSILLLVFLIRSRKTSSKLWTIYWIEVKFSQKRPLQRSWTSDLSLWNSFFPSPQSVVLFRTYIKSKEAGLEGTEARGRQWNGAVANTFCDVQGVLFVCCFNLWVKGYSSYLELKSAEGKCRPYWTRSTESQSLEAWVAPLLRLQNLSGLTAGRRLSVRLGVCTLQKAVLAGLAAKAKLPGIAGKIDSFPFKNYKSFSSAHIYISWREKPYWKNFCLFLTCLDSDYVSSSSLECVWSRDAPL